MYGIKCRIIHVWNDHRLWPDGFTVTGGTRDWPRKLTLAVLPPYLNRWSVCSEEGLQLELDDDKFGGVPEPQCCSVAEPVYVVPG